jgi:hypothetical protein
VRARRELGCPPVAGTVDAPAQLCAGLIEPTDALSPRACFGLLALAAIGLTLRRMVIGELDEAAAVSPVHFSAPALSADRLLALAGVLLPGWWRVLGSADRLDGSRRTGDRRLPELAAAICPMRAWPAVLASRP